MIYVPIIKWKKGERKALEMLSSSVKEQIVPLIDIPVSTKAKETICDEIRKTWDYGRFFLYLEPEWYEEDSENYEESAFSLFNSFYDNFKGQKVIPVFDLSNCYAIEKWINYGNGVFAVLIREKEMPLVLEELNSVLKDVDKSLIDIIIDLKKVDEDSVFSKQAALKAVLLDLDNPESFNSIIVSSNSFPSDVAKIEIDKIEPFRRYELVIDETARKLSKKLNFNYVYSDYGPTDLTETSFVVGMSPNFKIKYTAMDQYCYLKGKLVKKGGLDIVNVKKSCNILVGSQFFKGPDFSWADNEIFLIASGIKPTAGNLTTWVSYNFNHHISYVVFQLKDS